MTTIGITGGTGTVGAALCPLLVEQGYKVMIFTRNPERHAGNDHVSFHKLDPGLKIADAEALAQLDAIVHLAGEPVAGKRWSAVQKGNIVASRVQGTSFLVEQLRKYGGKCRVMIGASAIGYYGADKPGLKPFDEEAPAADDFLADTCVRWEKEERAAAALMRLAIVRIGIVLDKRNGAYAELSRPLKFGLMPLPGGGKQVVSWIHVEDVAGIIVYLLQHKECSGVYNLVAPSPVSNEKMMSAIARAMRRPAIKLPVPGFLLKIAIGEMAVEILKSATVSAAKLLQSGYDFKYPDIESAASQLESSNS